MISNQQQLSAGAGEAQSASSLAATALNSLWLTPRRPGVRVPQRPPPQLEKARLPGGDGTKPPWVRRRGGEAARRRGGEARAAGPPGLGRTGRAGPSGTGAGGGRWQVAGGRWQVAGGRWQVLWRESRALALPDIESHLGGQGLDRGGTVLYPAVSSGQAFTPPGSFEQPEVRLRCSNGFRSAMLLKQELDQLSVCTCCGCFRWNIVPGCHGVPSLGKTSRSSPYQPATRHASIKSSEMMTNSGLTPAVPAKM